MDKVLCLLFLVCLGCHATPPNIIIFVGDDVGFNDLGFHGSSQIPTPNIDALAYRGVILDKFYTQQSCTPSRAALLTGNYPIRSGLQGLPILPGEERHLPLDMPTLPEKLKGLGYKTHLVGKWHLGYSHRNYTPTERGFDTHFGFLDGYCGYFNYEVQSEYKEDSGCLPNRGYFDLYSRFTPQHGYQGRYSTDLFTEKSLDVIDEHDTSHPLFLKVSYLAAHTGYDGVELGVPNVTETERKYPYIENPRRKLYADVVNLMDESIGQIVLRLQERGMLENSIIMYFNDNGGPTIGTYANEASNWPFRGIKITLFEGGVRGTGVIYSPLFEKSGYVNKHLIHITDLMPTLYHAAGGDVGDLGAIDGINQWEVLSKDIPTNRTEVLLNIDEMEHNSGILGYNGRYKLLSGSFRSAAYNQYYGDSGRGSEVPSYDHSKVLDSPVNAAILRISNDPLTRESIENTRSAIDRSQCKTGGPVLPPLDYYLYDLDEDPCETDNLIDVESKVDIVKTLKAKLDEYFKVIVPQGNEAPNPKSDPNNCNKTWYFWQDPDGCYLDSLKIENRGSSMPNFFHWFIDTILSVFIML